MAKNMRRVVVTGCGAIGPTGNTMTEFWAGLKQAQGTAAKVIERFDTSECKVHFACQVYDFDPDSLFSSPKETRKSDRVVWYAIAAGRDAWKDSGLDLSKCDPTRIGCIVGTGMGGLETMESQLEIVMKRGPGRVSPFAIPKMIPNMASGMVSIDLGLKGPNFCVCSACATGANAIGEAFHAIQLGQMDIAVAGGTEACVTKLAVAGFSNMMALSMRNDDPTHSSRPFDKNRDGFVMGEGAGLLVVEELEHALQRGARIYAELVGYGATGDAFHITAPDPEGNGGYGGMKMALDEAGLSPEDVDYINAHGTGTMMNDKVESLSIRKLFGKHAYKLAVSSTKGVTGHMLGAAGAIEAAICVKSIAEGVIPCTVNYETPDPDCDLDIVPNEWRKQDIRVAISNSLGFGGHNATLAFKRYE